MNMAAVLFASPTIGGLQHLAMYASGSMSRNCPSATSEQRVSGRRVYISNIGTTSTIHRPLIMRQVTVMEDRLFRTAAARASKFVARGRLRTR